MVGCKGKGKRIWGKGCIREPENGGKYDSESNEGYDLWGTAPENRFSVLENRRKWPGFCYGRGAGLQ